MKVHKIYRVEKSVCCAEQKIAANLAFRAHISYQDEFDRIVKDGTQAAVNEFVHYMIDQEINNYRNAYDTTQDRYNIDAIFSALGAGLERYMHMRDSEKLMIETNYQAVGEAFPLNYPIE